MANALDVLKYHDCRRQRLAGLRHGTHAPFPPRGILTGPAPTLAARRRATPHPHRMRTPPKHRAGFPRPPHPVNTSCASRTRPTPPPRKSRPAAATSAMPQLVRDIPRRKFEDDRRKRKDRLQIHDVGQRHADMVLPEDGDDRHREEDGVQSAISDQQRGGRPERARRVAAHTSQRCNENVTAGSYDPRAQGECVARWPRAARALIARPWLIPRAWTQSAAALVRIVVCRPRFDRRAMNEQ